MSGVHATREIRLVVNGEEVVHQVAVRRLLADFLREDLGLTATRLACEHGVCGACTVILDGRSVRSCLLFAVQADGAEVRTVEGMAEGDRMHPLQKAFWDHHAIQCGFCTSGFLMTALELVESRSSAEEEEVRQALSGNLCRCTGYANVVAAVLAVLKDRA
ncbi:MAG: (2Fe-2S)-binding protein [Candidatus Binatia bacterium]|jgi:aerobic carbon-monoxide dehydrogenase small subunit